MCRWRAVVGHPGGVPLIPFSQLPTQEVILPSGDTAVIRVVRGNQPPQPENPLRFNWWTVKVLVSRITWAIGPSRSKDWRVEVQSRSVGGGHWATLCGSRDEANGRAAEVLDSLQHSGTLPG